MKSRVSRLFFLILVTLLLSGLTMTQAQKKKVQREETPNERFYRKGGKTTKAEVISQNWELTSSDIAQGRNLDLYDNGGHFNCYIRYKDETEDACDIPKVREFIWQHWQNKQRGYIRITFGSVDAKSTSHLFIEPNGQGEWHVAWRIVRHLGEIDDMPDIRSVRQRNATREDYTCDCKPGTLILSFLDWEGDENKSL